MIPELFKYHGSTTINRKAVFVFPLWHNYSFHLPTILKLNCKSNVGQKIARISFFITILWWSGSSLRTVWSEDYSTVVESSIEADNPSTNVLWVLWLTNCWLPVYNLLKLWNQLCSYIDESKSESNILKSKKIKSSCDFIVYFSLR